MPCAGRDAHSTTQNTPTDAPPRRLRGASECTKLPGTRVVPGAQARAAAGAACASTRARAVRACCTRPRGAGGGERAGGSECGGGGTCGGGKQGGSAGDRAIWLEYRVARVGGSHGFERRGPWRLQPPWARRAWRAAACDSTRPFSAREGLWTPPSAGQLPWVVLGRGACSARGRGAAASRERLSRFESPCGGRRALREGRGEGEGREGGGGAWSGGEGGESAGSRSQGLEYRRFDGRRGFEKRDAVGAVAPTASAVSHRHQPPAARRARSCRRRASGSKAGGAGGWPGGVARGGAPSRSSRRLGAPCRPARGLASQGPDSGPKATF